jgi:hypothetical protein
MGAGIPEGQRGTVFVGDYERTLKKVEELRVCDEIKVDVSLKLLH